MKKILSAVLVAAMALSFAACGSTSTESQAPASGSASTGSGETVTLEFFQMKDEGTDYYAELIAAFEEQYPNIKIEYTNVPDAETVIMTRMASNQVPDVFTHYALDPTFREQIKAGYVMDLTGEPMLENVDENILEMSLVDGKAYSVPVSLNMLGIYYNKDLFQQAGVTAVPTTIDELYEVCEQLKAAGIQPFIFPDKDVWTVRQFCDRASVTMLEDPQGLFEQIAAGEVTAADSPELKAMGETIVKLRSYAQEDNLGVGYEQAIADFANGKAAMFFSGTFAYPLIQESNPDVNIEMFPYPSMGGANTDRLGVNVDTAFCVSATTEHPEEAKLFVEFCTSVENAQKFCDYDGSPSAIKGVTYNNEVFQGMFTNYIETGKTINIPSNSWPASFGGEYGNICQELIDSGDVDAWLENLNQLILDTYNE